VNPLRTLSTDNVTVRFGGLVAISSVSLSLSEGEIVGLIGPNGAGKTTFVNCLSGFQQPTGGKVLLGDHDTAAWSTPQFRREGISRTFQGGRLFKDMTVLENVEVAGVGLGLSRREAQMRSLALLEWLGLSDVARRPAGSLPYTDERRVGIARALIKEPSFVLLDEPAAGMSELECDGLMDVVRQIKSVHGCGVLLIEHNMSVVMGVCDRIHVLDGGRTLAEGLPADVARNEAVVAAYLGSEA
jgi:branched-chain amino acid transport system ATP-binding protein